MQIVREGEPEAMGGEAEKAVQEEIVFFSIESLDRELLMRDIGVIQSLRCGTCKRFAYADLMMGNFGLSGYTCRPCVGWIDGAYR